MTNRPVYYECEICDHIHSAYWNGDCRENDARFTYEQLNAKYGEGRWDLIAMENVEAFQADKDVPVISASNFAGKTY